MLSPSDQFLHADALPRRRHEGSARPLRRSNARGRRREDLPGRGPVRHPDHRSSRFYPPGTRVPLASTLNFGAGQTRANNAVIPLGTGGSIAIVCGQPAGGVAHAVIDVNGYFE